MVDKGDNFALHQRALKASVSSALDARSISAINKKEPSGKLNFPAYYCVLRLGTTHKETRVSRGAPESCC